jgi:cysteine synthase B
VTLCVPSSASKERLTVLNALGAEVILTDGSEGSDGAILRARDLAERHPERFWYANQYDNPANWIAHYVTTGPEVLAQTNGSVTHLVGAGTTGTLVGTGRYLRSCPCGDRGCSLMPPFTAWRPQASSNATPHL